jgi:hypothetical protein
MDLSGQLHALVNLLPDKADGIIKELKKINKASPYQLNRRLGGPQNRSGSSETVPIAAACNGKEMCDKHVV